MKSLKRAKWMLGIVAFGLVVSGITIWPAVPELKIAVRIVGGKLGTAGLLKKSHGDALRLPRDSSNRSQ